MSGGIEGRPEAEPNRVEDEPISSVQLWMDRWTTFRIENQMNMGSMEAGRVTNALKNLNAALNKLEEEELPSPDELVIMEMTSLTGAEEYFRNKNLPALSHIARRERLNLKAGLTQESKDQGDI